MHRVTHTLRQHVNVSSADPVLPGELCHGHALLTCALSIFLNLVNSPPARRRRFPFALLREGRRVVRTESTLVAARKRMVSFDDKARGH